MANQNRACLFLLRENHASRHAGILHYTVGQRKGLGIALGRPVFIREIDPQSGNIYLADKGKEAFSKILLRDVVTISGKPLNSRHVLVKSVQRLFHAALLLLRLKAECWSLF